MKLLKLLCITLFIIESSTLANQFPEDLKSALFNKQKELMGQEAFNKFIEHYLLELENTLDAAKYCIKNPESSVCKIYFNRLSDFSIDNFQHYYNPNSLYNTVDYRLGRIALIISIEDIKKESKHDFDVLQEIDKTEQLLKKANVEYYKQLSIKAKISLWWESFLKEL